MKARGLLLIIILVLIFSLNVFCDQKIFKKVSTIDESVNPDNYEYIPESGDYKIYYIDYEGNRKYWIFEMPNKIDVIVISSCYYDGDSKLYKYSYEIRNLSTSKQSINKFNVYYNMDKIYIKGYDEPLDVIQPIINQTRYKNINSKYYIKDIEVPTISNVEWIFLPYLKNNCCRFLYISEIDFGIKPGDNQDGLSFKSNVSPGIVNGYIIGYTDTWKFSNYEGELAMDNFPFKHDEAVFNPVFVMGKIIGPVVIDENISNEEIVDYLIYLKHQAFDEGWIDNKGVLNSLDVKLEQVKKHIQKDEIKTALNILEAFLNEVEAQKNKHLTSEAYTLLKFNGLYLKEKLESQK